MFKKFLSIMLAALLQCSLPLAHANITELDVETSLLYTTENTGGNILPHFLFKPSFGGKILADYPTDYVNLTFGLSGVYTYFQNSDQSHFHSNRNNIGGYTALSVGISKKIGTVHLSAQETYMHTTPQNKADFFQDDMYETVLKAELATGTQRPYIFIGIITPAYIPIEKIIGMGGFGFISHIPLYQDAMWSTGIHSDISIATSLCERETVARARVVLQTQLKNFPRMDFGFNFFQDIQRQEYNTWWDANVSWNF